VEKIINKTYVIPERLDIRIKKQAAEEHTQSNIGRRGVSKKK
jgi:hypothetical protein